MRAAGARDHLGGEIDPDSLGRLESREEVSARAPDLENALPG